MTTAYPAITPGFLGSFTEAQMNVMPPVRFPLQEAFVLNGSSLPPYGYFVVSDGVQWLQRTETKGIVAPGVKADGTTDDTAALTAALSRLPDNGGTILLPSGIIRCNNLVVPNKPVIFQGASRAGLTSNGVTGTRLQSDLGASVMTQTGTNESTRAFYLGLRDLALWGSGDASAAALFLKYVSYFRAQGVSFGNCGAQLAKFWDVYDSRLYDCEFTYGGSADGTLPAMEWFSEGGSSATNEIYMDNTRWESCPGTALGLTGSNTFSCRVTNFKMESSSSAKSFVKATGAVDITISKGIMTSGAPGITLPNFIDLTSCQAIDVDCTFQMNGAGSVPTNYIKTVSGDRQKFVARILDPAPAPVSGNIISWDGNQPKSFEARIFTSLTSKPYDYYFGSQLSPIDSSATSGVPVSGGTTVIPPYVSAFALFPAGTIATHTITLPSGATLANGQPVTVYSSQAITALTVNGGTINGAPTTLAANGFFTMRYLAGVSWFRAA